MMGLEMEIFDHYQKRYQSTKQEELTLHEYLELCKNEPLTYANAAETYVASYR